MDELNSFLGAMIAEIPRPQAGWIATLQDIQADLFLIGAWIATTPDSPAASQLQSFEIQRVNVLEKGIDEMIGLGVIWFDFNCPAEISNGIFIFSDILK